MPTVGPCLRSVLLQSCCCKGTRKPQAAWCSAQVILLVSNQAFQGLQLLSFQFYPAAVHLDPGPKQCIIFFFVFVFDTCKRSCSISATAAPPQHALLCAVLVPYSFSSHATTAVTSSLTAQMGLLPFVVLCTNFISALSASK